MATAEQIRAQLRQWLDGNISFRQFEEWFVPVAGSIAAQKDPEAESLVDDIDMGLSEYSDGVLTASELREELTRIARPFVVRIVSIDSYFRVDPYALSKPKEMELGQLTRKPVMVQMGRVEDRLIECC